MSFDAGLGVGAIGDREGMVTSVIFDENGQIKGTVVKTPGGAMSPDLSSPALKGKRKPVPRILDVEIEAEDEFIPHAL
jgi:hypothetical protein